MTNHRSVAAVLAVVLCFAVVPAVSQKPADTISSKLPAICIVAAEGLSAKVEGARLLYENGKTIVEYAIVNTDDEALLDAELTLLVYDRTGKRRGTQVFPRDSAGLPEPRSRQTLRDEITAVRIDASDRVLVSITALDTSAGPWRAERFAEQTDSKQLPVVDVIDPRPLPVILKSPRLSGKDRQIQVEVDLVNTGENAIDRATLTLLVYGDKGKRTGLQDMEVADENLPLGGGSTIALRLPIDASVSIESGNFVRLGVSRVVGAGIESKNDRLATDSEPASDLADVIVLNPDGAPVTLVDATMIRDAEGVPLLVRFVMQNRTQDPVIGLDVAAFVFQFNATRGYVLRQTRFAPFHAILMGCAARVHETPMGNAGPRWRVVLAVAAATSGGKKWAAKNLRQQAEASLLR